MKANPEPSPSLFVGREAELDLLGGLARRVEEAMAWTVIIEGAPGMGSTALTAEFTQRLVGFHVVRAPAARIERHVPYALLEHLAAMIAGGSRTRQQRPRWRDASVDTVAADLLALLERLERRTPVLIVLDDAQWADRESLAALRFVLRRLGAERILTLLVGRHGRGTWDSLESRHDWPERVERITLGGLDDTDLIRLTAHHGRSVMAHDMRRRLLDVTDGNPLYLRALLSDPSPLMESFLAGRTPLPPPIIDALGGLVASLGPEEQSLLEALAVLDSGASITQLDSVLSSQDAAAVAQGLAPTGIVRWLSDGPSRRLTFSNDLLRSVVVARTPPARTSDLHAAAAEVTGPPERWGHLAVSASALDRPELVNQLEAVAEAELADRNFDVAAHYLLWAHELAGSSPRADALMLRGVQTLVYAAHDSTARSYESAVRALPPSSARTETLGLLSLADGQVASARDLLETARSDPPDRSVDVHRVERVNLELAHACSLLGLGGATIDAATSALEARSDTGWPDAARAYIAIGTAFENGALAGLATLDWMPTQASECGPAHVPALAQRGMLRGLVGRFDEAITDLTVAARRRSGTAGLLGLHAFIHLTWCQLLHGEWGAAQRTVDIALSSLDDLGRRVDQSSVLALSSILHASRGDRDQALSDLAHADDAAAGCDHLGPTVQLAIARAIIARADRDPAGVLDALRSVAPHVIEPERAQLFAVWWLPILADAQIDVHDLPAARRSIATLRTADADGPSTPIAVARLDARLHDAYGDADQARTRYEQGVQLAVSTGDFGWHHALLRASYGRHLIERGESEAAAVHLRYASSLFQRFGARPDQADTEAALELSRVDADTASAWRAALTPRELEIADLVGRGWTNPEIGAATFISNKTVEYHLRNTYMKLGITSRRQLRDLSQQAGV